MVDSPELVKITLKLYEESALVQGVIFNAGCPSELNFDLVVSIKEIPSIDLSTASSHLKALLYETPDSPESFTTLETLTTQSSTSTLALFSEPNREFGNVFILVRSSDPSGLGSYFTGARFGLYQYHYKDLLGENPQNYISFIRLFKITKSNFIQKTQKKFLELEEKKQEKKQYEELADYLNKRSERLKEELETAKQAIQQLNYQLDKKQSQVKERQEQNLECIICRSHLKEVVFLPCGHIILCKSCMIETMNLSPNTVLNKRTNPVKCPLCKTLIKESKEIHF